MLRRSFLTGAVKAAILSIGLSTGLNRLAAILPARNKTKYDIEWVANRQAWLVTNSEVIGGSHWMACEYMAEKSDLEGIMQLTQKALTNRYNLIHGVS